MSIKDQIRQIFPDSSDEKILYWENKIREEVENEVLLISSGIDQDGQKFILVESKEGSKQFIVE